MADLFHPDKCKIYILRNDVDDCIYIGSTDCKDDDGKKRMSQHSRAVGSKRSKTRLLFRHCEAIGGFHHFKMEIIDRPVCQSKKELLIIEGNWQRKLKPKLNYEIAGRTPEQYRQETQCDRLKYIKNKDYILQRNKKYYETHKEDIHNKNNTYRLNNIETIRANKSKKVLCECGKMVSNGHLARHRKSKAHNVV